jgi:hypothetical protein
MTCEANGPTVPSWTEQIHISLLTGLGEHEAKMNLRDSLLASRIVTDAYEPRIILMRLEESESVENSSESSKR